MKTLLVTLVSLAAVPALSDWTPPENPSPTAILHSARDDAQHGRYEDALAKHVWYHENALKIQRSQAGVRLSFALKDWKKLGELYPPALEKLKQTRDEAGQQAKKGADVFRSFHDFTAINRVLGDERKTVKLFKELDLRDSDETLKVFRVAEPALVRAKEYALCGRYLDPAKQIEGIVRMYRIGKEYEAKHPERPSDFATKNFINESTTLVALLVVNDRKDEAEEAAKAFRQERDDADFRAALDEALKGNVPKPWP